MTAASAVHNPLHSTPTEQARWSRQIVAEALPGVLTPLNWSIWGYSGERAMRAAHFDAGVLPASQVEPPAAADERAMAIFYGRAAVNIDRLREWADLTPGVSGAQFEEHYHGSDRTRTSARLALRRYPIVAAKLPLNVVRLPWRMPRLRARAHAWWERCRSESAEADEAGARDLLVRSRHALHRVARPHALNNIVILPIYQRLSELAEQAGGADAFARLTSGYGGLEETDLSADLWNLSRGRGTLKAFLSKHGYHSPDEGEIASRSWREDPEPVRALLEGYRSSQAAEDPREVERRGVRRRESLQAEILAALPPSRRPGARLAFRLARSFLPLRQLGHNSSVQMLDALRIAVRTLSGHWAARGSLDRADDVFFLTLEELLSGPPADARERVAFRRARWQSYRELDLPPLWSGSPRPQPRANSERAPRGPIEGRGVSPGRADGAARVVAQPEDAGALEPGDVLVCHTTDPSWTPYFALASAVVIEIGGPLSHGAIVARELGIPCVIAPNATRLIPDGERIRVDGSEGRVELATD